MSVCPSFTKRPGDHAAAQRISAESNGYQVMQDCIPWPSIPPPSPYQFSGNEVARHKQDDQRSNEGQEAGSFGSLSECEDNDSSKVRLEAAITHARRDCVVVVKGDLYKVITP